MNVQNQPVHVMACVVKREIPPHVEMETLWVSTWKKHIRIGNKQHWVEGVHHQLDSWLINNGIFCIFPRNMHYFLTARNHKSFLKTRSGDNWTLLTLWIYNSLQHIMSLRYFQIIVWYQFIVCRLSSILGPLFTWYSVVQLLGTVPLVSKVILWHFCFFDISLTEFFMWIVFL